MVDTSKTVHHALDVLVDLTSRGPAPATTIAARLDLSRTVVLRLLATLEAHDLVRRTAAGFDVGLGVLGLAAGVESRIRDLARPALADLAERFRETAVLSVRDGLHAVAVDQVVPYGRVLRVHYPPGSRHLLTATAHGRCMLATLPPEDAEVRGDAGAGLEPIRKAGYAVSHDDLETGVSGLAAAVEGERGVVASIGVVAPTARMPSEDELGPAIRDAAARVAAALRGD